VEMRESETEITRYNEGNGQQELKQARK